MKNRKWLTYTLGTLLTLVVLATVAGVSFRIGMMQNNSFARPAFVRGFNGAPQAMQSNFQNNGGTQDMQGNPHGNDGFQGMQGNFRRNDGTQMRDNPRNRGFDNFGGNRGADQRGGRMSFFFPFIFGLLHLVVLGLILWAVFMLVKKSGWRLTRVTASPAPVANTVANVDVDEKKASE